MQKLFILLTLCMVIMTAPAKRVGSEVGAMQHIVINEVQVANVDCFIDPSFNYGGWVELYNPTETTISLADMKLCHIGSDGKFVQEKLQEAHGVLPPHGYCLLWFDHNSKDGFYGPHAEFQIPFKLDMDGGFLELLDSSGNIVEVVGYPPAIPRCSYARITDGNTKWGTTDSPTPRQSNDESHFAVQRLEMPQVDCTGGVFSSPVVFRVTVPAGATLHYTTDGSTPVPGQCATSDDGVFSVSATSIYRFMLTADDCLSSPVATRSFIFQDKKYYLPILSVTTHPDNLFGDSIGLYVCGVNGRVDNHNPVASNQNMDWERPVNIEYFVPDTLTGTWNEALNMGASFSIFGGWSRFNDGDDFFQFKPSFKLKAEKEFERQSFFPYPIFSSKPYIKNKSILVRNGGQDQYARLQDAAIQKIIRTSGVYIDCQAWQPAHVFLDGHYLGMFNLREPSNWHFAYSNYGIVKSEIDQWEDELSVKVGNISVVRQWLNLSQQLADNPANTATWQTICKLVDVDEYCNYMAAEIYTGNMDFLRKGLKNIKGFRSRNDGGKVHYVLFDLDASFGHQDLIEKFFNEGTGRQIQIFRNMMSYEPFRRQFVDTYCLMGGSVFNPQRSVPIIQKMAAQTLPALQWEGNDVLLRADILSNLMLDLEGEYQPRIDNLKRQLKLDGELQVSIESSASILLNGREIPTGRFSGTLFGPLQLTAIIPAGHDFLGWEMDGTIVSVDTVLTLPLERQEKGSCIVACYEKTARPIPPVRINEVGAANGVYISDYMKKSDWIELYNTTDETIDLAGMYLSDDSSKLQKSQIVVSGTSDSSVSSLIPPHGYRIVWCDKREAISQLHASFKLANKDGGFISIQATDGSWTDSLRYQAQGRWQSFGRYPNGTNNVALFDRITIGQTNHINTQTEVVALLQPDLSSAIEPVFASGRNVIAVSYYNLQGQRIRKLEPSAVVIQSVIYDDGTRESRKIRIMPTR